MKKGEIYYADLSPVIGSEQGGNRPVVVIQNNVGNKNSSTVIVAAITSEYHNKHKIPTHVRVENIDESGLPNDSIVLLEQIRTIDKSRLESYVGAVSPVDMVKINTAIMISLGLTASHNKR
ncbi:MAG: type II toxin-antitoxin system PemK/MazF family toxin [Anaerovoracaceae bacterium]